MNGIKWFWCLCILPILMFFSGCQNNIVIQEAPPIIMVPENELGEALTLEEIQALGTTQVQITHSPETHMVKEIKGVFSPHMIINEYDVVVALGSVRKIMDITDFSFSCSQIDERKDSVVFSLTQVYHGVPVMDYGFRVGADKDGTPLFVSGVFRNDINISINPVYSASKCAEFLSLSSGEIIRWADLVIYVKADEDLLCWKYYIASDDPLQNRIICCDAITGEVVAVIFDAVA